jgi:hypothetical protein
VVGDGVAAVQSGQLWLDKVRNKQGRTTKQGRTSMEWCAGGMVSTAGDMQLRIKQLLQSERPCSDVDGWRWGCCNNTLGSCGLIRKTRPGSTTGEDQHGVVCRRYGELGRTA